MMLELRALKVLPQIRTYLLGIQIRILDHFLEKINRLTSEKVALELVVRAEQKEKSDLEIRRTKAIESTQEAEAGLKRLKESPEMTGKW